MDQRGGIIQKLMFLFTDNETLADCSGGLKHKAIRIRLEIQDDRMLGLIILETLVSVDTSNSFLPLILVVFNLFM